MVMLSFFSTCIVYAHNEGISERHRHSHGAHGMPQICMQSCNGANVLTSSGEPHYITSVRKLGYPAHTDLANHSLADGIISKP